METTDTRTRQLTVNAAFLKDIKDDNHDLKLILEKIAPLAQHPQTAINHWSELVARLSDLRDQLALHFSLEEAYGYFDDAVTHAPELTANAMRLRNQHRDLFERIRKLAEKAPELSTESPEKVSRFLDSYQAFRDDFAHHEEAELQLILDALGQDIGVGD